MYIMEVGYLNNNIISQINEHNEYKINNLQPLSNIDFHHLNSYCHYFIKVIDFASKFFTTVLVNM